MRFLSLLLVMVLATYVSGCATFRAVATQAEAESASYGTLADANNPYEMAATPTITQVAVYRKQAADLLREKSITRDTAIAAQKCADDVRADVLLGVGRKAMPIIDAGKQKLTYCKSLIEVHK